MFELRISLKIVRIKIKQLFKTVMRETDVTIFLNHLQNVM